MISRTPPVLFLLLGASNLSRAYYGLAKYLERRLHPRPIRIFNALGPGRGYCTEGGLLNFVYPPIGTCGVCEAAHSAKPGRVLALVTDIGNDIMYDIPAERIIAGLQALFEKLKALDADILITTIPRYLESEMDDFHFRCLRTVFFPRSCVEMQKAIAAVRQINRFLQSTAGARIKIISGLEDFYGIDKIHFSPLKMHMAWTRLAMEMFRILEVEVSERITRMEMLSSLGSQVFRLTLSDMFQLREKGPDFF